MKLPDILKIAGISAYFVFIIISQITGFGPGRVIGGNFIGFSLFMLKILPAAFILIGLFEVWVKREMIEKHLGEESGIKGYIWALILAGTTVGGLYVAIPVAYSLLNKGAKFSVIFSYLGAAAICKIPMIIFEASFLGLKFSLIRLFVSLPLVIISSMLLGSYLAKKNYRVIEGK